MYKAEVIFQKSSDAGRTWLSAGAVIRPEAGNPDITTDSDGNIYLTYLDSLLRHLHCVRSTDGGTSWSTETRVNDANARAYGARIAAGSAGYLLCTWNDARTGSQHVWSSLSTDQGETWRPNVRVDDDTTSTSGSGSADVFMQPGTNHCFVAAEVPYDSAGNSGWCCKLYRSVDVGRTFQPAGRFDVDGAGQPHVVADARYAICNYNTGHDIEARTFDTQSDTWSVPCPVGSSWQAGGLAISADGRVHTVRQARPPGGGPYYAYYDFSADHGAFWSNPEPANDDSNAGAYDPDIAVDAAGSAYVVWRNLETGALWFATNNPAAIAEEASNAGPRTPSSGPTVVRGVLFVTEATSYRTEAASLSDISGRKVQNLHAGANDVSRLAPGVYFVRERVAADGERSAVRKVVVTR